MSEINASVDTPAHSFITPTLEKGSLVLVTGATGYVASHCIDQLLEAGYHVRGTVRSEDKAQWLYTLFTAKYGPDKFSTVHVPDMSSDNAFDAAVQNVSGILHVASVTALSSNPDDMVPATVKGALNILTAATKEPAVKSLVYTSSSVSATQVPAPTDGSSAAVKISDKTWNDEAVRVTASSTPTIASVYAASKVSAERAIWSAVKASKPPFQVCAILPGIAFGQILKPEGVDAGSNSTSSTASLLLRLFHGATNEGKGMKIASQWFVDVRDAARLHVAALIDPECDGKRIFAFAGKIDSKVLLATFRMLYPGMVFAADADEDAFAKDESELVDDGGLVLLRKHYGKDYTPLEESVRENTAAAAAASL